MMKKTIRTCFISAPYGTDLTAIKSALASKSIRPLILTEMPSHGGMIVEKLTETIRESDLVLIVLSSGKQDLNAYFEIGFAYALNKQLLVLAPPDTHDLSLDVAGILYIRAGVENRDAISFALEQIPSIPKHKIRKWKAPISTTEPKEAKRIGSLLTELSSLQNPTERQLHDLIVRAIEASGISAYAYSDRELGVDIAIWSDDLPPSLGNPFLIEIKHSIKSQRQLNQIANQIVSDLHASKARWLLVLFYEANPSLLARLFSLHPNVLFMSIKEFIERLQSESFEFIVSDLWNRAVHGLGGR